MGSATPTTAVAKISSDKSSEFCVRMCANRLRETAVSIANAHTNSQHTHTHTHQILSFVEAVFGTVTITTGVAATALAAA